MTQTDTFLTTPEAAEFLAIQPTTLETWRVRRSEGPPYVKVGRAVRYRRSDLEAYIVARRRTCTATEEGPPDGL